MDEIEELRGRVDAQERVLFDMVSLFFADPPIDLRREMFVSGLETVANMAGPPRNMSDEDAMEHADRMVMMQAALKRLIQQFRVLLGMPEAPGL